MKIVSKQVQQDNWVDFSIGYKKFGLEKTIFVVETAIIRKNKSRTVDAAIRFFTD